MPVRPVPLPVRCRPRLAGPLRLRRAAGLVLLGAWTLAAGLAIAAPPPPPVVPPPAQGVPPAAPPLPAAPRSSEAFDRLLREGNLDQLLQACGEALQFDQSERLRQLQQRLLVLHPAPQPLPVVLANADALLRCQAPVGAREVLERYGPAPGAERQQWLLLQWRAAAAGLDHRRALIALGRLVELEGADLERIALPVRINADGTVVSRPALDLLIDHWVSLGRPREAARLAGASTAAGELAARRRRLAASLESGLGLAERNQLLEVGLEQAAAAGAWGLVAELLDQQLALQRSEGGDPSQAIERRLRLSPAMDDAYGEWLLRRQLPHAAGSAEDRRLDELERQLRSPRAPGGHADPTPSPAEPQP